MIVSVLSATCSYYGALCELNGCIYSIRSGPVSTNSQDSIYSKYPPPIPTGWLFKNTNPLFEAHCMQKLLPSTYSLEEGLCPHDSMLDILY